MTKKQRAYIEYNAQFVHAGRVAAEQGMERIAPYTDTEQNRHWLTGYDVAKYIEANHTGK